MCVTAARRTQVFFFTCNALAVVTFSERTLALGVVVVVDALGVVRFLPCCVATRQEVARVWMCVEKEYVRRG